MDLDKEMRKYMENLWRLMKLQREHLQAQSAHDRAQDELLRMTSAFTQRDANKLLAECLARKK